MSNEIIKGYLNKLPIVRGVTTHKDVVDFINRLVDKINLLSDDIEHVEDLIKLIENIEVIEGIEEIINDKIDDRIDSLEESIDQTVNDRIDSLEDNVESIIESNKPIIEIGTISTTTNPSEIGGSVVVNGNRYTINLVIPESLDELTQQEIIDLLNL